MRRKGKPRTKVAQKIWCECEVVVLANGTTTTVTPDDVRCKKLAEAGAVRISDGPRTSRAMCQRRRASRGTSSRTRRGTQTCIWAGVSPFMSSKSSRPSTHGSVTKSRHVHEKLLCLRSHVRPA